MENAMVPVSSLIAMFVTLALMVGAPVVAGIFGVRKCKKNGIAILAGFLSFAVMQLVIRFTLLKWLGTQPAFVQFMTDYKWLSAASLAITASLFEGGGRLLTARFIVRPKRYTPGNAIWHGVGHGGTESIYLSLMFINNIVFALMINSGQTGAVAAALPAGQFASISAALIQTPFWMFLIAGLERVMTLCVQIGLSVLAFEALRKKSVKIGLLMFLIHAVLDFAAPGMTMLGLSSNVGILLSEFVVLLFAVASVVMIVRLQRKWKEESEPTLQPQAQ